MRLRNKTTALRASFNRARVVKFFVITLIFLVVVVAPFQNCANNFGVNISGLTSLNSTSTYATSSKYSTVGSAMAQYLQDLWVGQPRAANQIFSNAFGAHTTQLAENADPGYQLQILQYLAAAGFTWVKDYISCAFDPTTGVSVADQCVNNLDSHHLEFFQNAQSLHLRPLIRIDMRIISNGEQNWPQSASDFQAYSQFASAYASRYGAYVSDWEIENEPNGGLMPDTPLSPQQYLALMAQAAAAIRAVQPSAKIYGPASASLSSMDINSFYCNWYSTVAWPAYDSSAQKNIYVPDQMTIFESNFFTQIESVADVFSVHPYHNTIPESISASTFFNPDTGNSCATPRWTNLTANDPNASTYVPNSVISRRSYRTEWA